MNVAKIKIVGEEKDILQDFLQLLYQSRSSEVWSNTLIFLVCT